MSFYQWGGQPAGSIADLITNSKLNANGYNWLTGLAGYEAPQTNAYYSGDGALTFQPTSNPAQINKTFQIKDYLGNLLTSINSDGSLLIKSAAATLGGQTFLNNVVIYGTASIANISGSTGTALPSLIVGGTASINTESVQSLIVNGAASIAGFVNAGSGFVTPATSSLASTDFSGNIIVTGTASIGSYGGRISAPNVGLSSKPLLNFVPVIVATKAVINTNNGGSTLGLSGIAVPTSAVAFMATALFSNAVPSPYTETLTISADNAEANIIGQAFISSTIGNVAGFSIIGPINATVGASPCYVYYTCVSGGGGGSNSYPQLSWTVNGYWEPA